MPAEQRGSVYRVKGGYGVRWREGLDPSGKERRRRYCPRPPFPTKTAARQWYAENVASRLYPEAPSGDERFEDFVELYLTAHAAKVDPRTIRTLRERLGASERQDRPDRGERTKGGRGPARTYRTAIETFGGMRLKELERATARIAAWEATLPGGYGAKLIGALSQVLGAAVEWDYIARNPARTSRRRRRGSGQSERRPEIVPFTRAEIDRLAVELGHQPDRGLVSANGVAVIFAAETGLRPEEWIALERRDLDFPGRAVTIAHAFSDGRLKDAKTLGSRRRVPLTQRALDALETLPPRLDTRLVFPAPKGGYLNLGNFRRRQWQPALESGGFVRCPLSDDHTAKRVGREHRCQEPGCEGRASAHRIYDLRHTFASWALAANISMFELARFMGTSVKIIDRHYGHLVRESEDTARAKLEAYAVSTQDMPSPVGGSHHAQRHR
jgi:integrase